MDNFEKDTIVHPFVPAIFPAESAPEQALPAESRVDSLPEPTVQELAQLWGQWVFDWVFLLPFAGLIVFLMRYAGGYRVENARAVRERFRELSREKKPLLICLNHLTFIDSALLMWALGSNGWYARNFSRFSWNLPAGDFFKKKFIYRVVAFFSKCIFIHRDGSKEHKNAILGICRYLLNRGEVLSIFPEGKRSRSGRFEPDKVTFGVGKILAHVPGCRVLCVYIRGDKQESWSNYPPKGSRLHISMELIQPRTGKNGREAYFELTSHVARTLKALEDRYFEDRAR